MQQADQTHHESFYAKIGSNSSNIMKMKNEICSISELYEHDDFLKLRSDNFIEFLKEIEFMKMTNNSLF